VNFIWPDLLWLLVAIPLLVALYVFLLHRNRKRALRYASLSMVKQALGAHHGMRKHLPPLLFLLGIASMLVAVARPTAIVTLPYQERTIVLAIDVSGSMRATDIEPNRLVAAQEAARAFVLEQPQDTRIGVVSFAATAALVQAPTQSRDAIMSAIDRLQLQYGTAIGSGLIVSLATLFPDAGIEIAAPGSSDAVVDIRHPEILGAIPFEAGSNTDAAIILLTDGESTTGANPVEAARLAMDLGVRVFTVGVGTPEGAVISVGGWSARVGLDEESLKQIAQMTHGEYFQAGTAEDLKAVYQNLNARMVFKTEQTEISALFAAAGALLVLLGAMLSMLWFNRVL